MSDGNNYAQFRAKVTAFVKSKVTTLAIIASIVAVIEVCLLALAQLYYASLLSVTIPFDQCAV